MEALSTALQPYKELVGTVAGIVTVGQMFSGSFLCYDIIKEKDTKGMNIMPFLGGFVLSILNLKYGFILRDTTMINVNFIGLAINIVYLMIFFNYASQKGKVWMQMGAGIAFASALIGYTHIEDPQNVEHRFGLIITALILQLIALPLFELGTIMKTKSTETLPFPLIFSSTIVTFMWLLYGIILRNNFIVILYYKMSEVNNAGNSTSKRPSTGSVQGPARKNFRAADPTFEQELSDLLASDQSDNEENIEDLFILESELRQNHESDSDEDQDQDQDPNQDQDSDQVLGEESDSDSSDNIPISQLVTSNYYYGINRYKWAKTPPLARVRTQQHHIITSRAGSSKLTQGSRRACRICPAKKHRMTTYVCVGCKKPVCLQCSRPLCTDCQ